MSDAARSSRRSRGWTSVRTVARTGRRFVHVEHSIAIARPVKELSDALVEGPASWFPRLRPGGVASIGLHVAGLPVRKKVKVDFGEPARTSTWAVVPVSWRATFPQALFPVMTGKVAVSSLSAKETRLTVSGMYEPPLGTVGEDLNEAGMRKLATATVKELTEHIAEHLTKTRRRTIEDR